MTDRVSDGRVIPDDEVLPIDSVTAYIALDPENNTEGIIGRYTGNGWMPMIAADHEMMVQLRPVAEDIARQLADQNVKVSLVRFGSREVLTDNILLGD